MTSPIQPTPILRIPSRGRLAAALALMLCAAHPAGADDAAPPLPAEPSRPGFGTRLLWYVPNRAMDLLDVFRLRLRIGPGWAANVRATDYGAFFAGQYDAVYVGLPGPRHPRESRRPFGRESLAGFVIAGVDATDDTLHGPEYGADEFNVGAHLLFVGADVGFGPVEFWDFLAGWFFFDPRGDDYPRREPPAPPGWTSALSIGEGDGVFAVDPKPASFGAWSHRLDYLQTNVPRRIDTPLRAADAYFAINRDAVEQPPQAQTRMKLYFWAMDGKSFETSIEPDVQLDVQLPNLERRVRLFFETSRSDELPERQLNERDDNGYNLGLRKWISRFHVSADAGVRAKWPPQAFTRLTWTREFPIGQWDFRPLQRFFLNTDDGLGSLTTLRLNRWFADDASWLFLGTASGKWTSDSDLFTWSESLNLAHVGRLLDETRRRRSVGWDDVVHGHVLQYTEFGRDGVLNTRRLSFAHRRPLYKQWVLAELGGGFEWDRDNDFDTAVFVHLGLDLIFWSSR